MPKLKISRDLSLPIDTVTQRISILGKTRSGKSHTAGVIVEEVLKAKQQVIILDPKGDWWGLRSSADGKSAGLDIHIMGGKKGDIPLEPTAGALIADLVINERISVVLDLSLFESKADEIRFVTAFLDRLYRKNTEPVLLVIDEGDVFAPQKPEKNETIMLNRMETICRRGAGRGIGVLLISQRSASIHKGCLSQTELMICHQTTSPQDKDAIKGWVVDHGDESRREEFLGAISKLKTGIAIVWSPSWLEIYRQVSIRRKETFDSGASPKVGESRRAPKILAEVDLERLRKHIAETIEKAKQEDPKLLRAEIQSLRKQLSEKQKQVPPVPIAKAPPPKTVIETKIRKLRVIQGPEVKAVEAVLVRFDKLRKESELIFQKLDKRLDGWMQELNGNLKAAVHVSEKLETPTHPAFSNSVMFFKKHGGDPLKLPIVRNPVQANYPKGAVDKRPALTKTIESVDDGELSTLQQRQLRGLVEFSNIGLTEVDRRLLAAWLGLSMSGHFKNEFGKLRTRGLISYAGPRLLLTSEGRSAAPPAKEAPDTDGIINHCSQALDSLRARQLRALHEAYPSWVPREELAQSLGLSMSGHFKNEFGKLHSAGQIDYGDRGTENAGKLRCAEWFFILQPAHA